MRNNEYLPPTITMAPGERNAVLLWSVLVGLVCSGLAGAAVWAGQNPDKIEQFLKWGNRINEGY
jgi:hypothetical protein